ncbi:3-hydroxyacyl-CoA dehydrogenase NAD-binding domain-containing protein [Jannaschia rubra]|uniref:Fatty acid oxidation complex subunit alpha n=1 Tax=Jannaschia rubra TaxID=282197 RepID=A0A0M6XR26_9RHOB|nr:3-hydroxyacyl-CoA dehydrogenase NAD-binding domain-containing protein [Jannaschia rubra]CTQ33328.1 Fatty acid oxidation complex subunit alpha [Jannaschia rubra]SFF99314.1 short chain enoyl-CoA hydratase /3-hydroxyacyl-CoA dehydrogenase [Jannaschia rubra]
MSPVRYALSDRIAVLTVDNPPVNALSQAVRAALADAVSRFAADEDAEIAVILGAGRLFIGGADISEFGKPPADPWLPEVIAAIEDCPKPIVAAIHGTALGGGLEVALGCHWRMAMPGTKLGLPEVTLGILPGAGGTQRLPRLVGLQAAAKMIASGKPMTAEAALDAGLIDHLGQGDDVLAAARSWAADLLAQGVVARPTGRMAAPSGDLSDMRAGMQAKSRGEVAPVTALDAVAASTSLSFADGMAEERRLFRELMDTPQRAGLIHAFFAERATAKLPEIAGIAPREIDRLGVIGGGTMGAGIATSALLAGLPVVLVERDEAAAGRARDTIAANLAAAVKRGKLDPDRRDTLLDVSLVTATDYDALAPADLLIEAVFESMEVKQEVFARLDAVARPGAVLATNTSYLDVDAIAAVTSRPQDVIGLHFFSPAHIMKLLEIVVARDTAPDVTATAFALARRLGKIPVRAGVCDGFIGNRILSHYRTAADHMVLDGASPYAIDRAIRDFGFAMGPYQVSDLAGLDIGFATRQRKAADVHPRDRAPTFADALYHAGRLGRKTKRGYYDYSDDPKGREDTETLRLVQEARTDASREFTDEEIVRRYMAAMVNEAARVVGDGIASRPLDVDVVFLHGYGFPRWRGGPMHWADTYGLDRILADIREFARDDDHFWQPAPLLTELADKGATFESLNRKDTK